MPEELNDVLNGRAVGDDVEARICPALCEHGGVDVARHGKVQLHDDMMLFVEAGELDEEIPEERLFLLFVERSALRIQFFGSTMRDIILCKTAKSVIRDAASAGNEV